MARTILYTTGTLAIFREVFYTLAQLSEETVAVPHVPTFQAQREALKDVLLQELSILELLAKAQAAVDRVDARLDRFVLRITRAVDDNTGGPTRKQLRKNLLKGKTISKFRRPTLGRQLLDMSDWSEVLDKCGVPALVAMAPEAAALYQLGKDAAKMRDDAQANNRSFRDVGARKQFIDALNAARTDVEGKLAQLPFQDPTLPQDFADSFFYREAPRDEEETIDDLEAAIKDQEAELADLKARLAKKEQEAADAAKEAQDEKDKAAQAAALKQQAADLLAQAAALEGK